MKTVKMTVNYETIQNMEVELPVKNNLVPRELLHYWVKAFIKYMTINCVCDNTVLISSIGKSNALKALIAGLEERITDPKILKVFIEDVSDESAWRYEVIKQREGKRAALEDKFGVETAQRMIEAFGEDRWF